MMRNVPGSERSTTVEPRRSAGSWPPSKTYAHCATSASRQSCSSAQQKEPSRALACALLHTSGHSSLNSSTASVLMPPLTLALVSASAPPCARATARMNSLSGTRMPASARCSRQHAAAGGARRTRTRQCERRPGSAPRTAQQAHARAPPSPDLAAVDACRQRASAGSMRPRLRSDSKHARAHRAAARPASRREGVLRSRTAPHPATAAFRAGSLGCAGASARACASPTHTESGTRSSLRLMAYKRCARDFASAKRHATRLRLRARLYRRPVCRRRGKAVQRVRRHGDGLAVCGGERRRRHTHMRHSAGSKPHLRLLQRRGRGGDAALRRRQQVRRPEQRARGGHARTRRAPARACARPRQPPHSRAREQGEHAARQPAREERQAREQVKSGSSAVQLNSGPHVYGTQLPATPRSSAKPRAACRRCSRACCVACARQCAAPAGGTVRRAALPTRRGCAGNPHGLTAACASASLSHGGR